MEKVGILVVSYGSRAAAIIDAFVRSEEYTPKIYVADKQKNPFNVKRAEKHAVIPDLNVKEILRFAKRHEDRIDFGIVGPEKPIIAGVRDIIEKETSIQMICPTRRYAIEASKIAQRQLFQKVAPEVNPKFKVFDPNDYRSVAQVKKSVYAWLKELKNEVAVKPDKATAGKGVGVWGDHFNTREEVFEHFISNYEHGPVIIEEKVEGEESSFQAFCDGKRLIPLPETRDYKRAFDEDKGPNTGGMGSYKDAGNILPFMTLRDREKEIELVNRVFMELKGKGSNPELRGIPFYAAFIHTDKGPKILEVNSRPGDPEIMNLLPILKDDFVEVCYNMLDGNLRKINFMDKATVVTYKVPPNYGGYATVFPDRVDKTEVDTAVDLTGAQKLAEKYGGRMRVYPGSMELRDGENFALGSRTVCVVGVGDDIQEAREKSLEGIGAIEGGALWNRNDIAVKEHIDKSVRHMEKLRRR
ncbi:MAG: ATP-grasp domain-containing protein [Candidatus Bathyarchaeota archaeon]|nr:ATP-grasp domain-containing protein [Candidatus Bathyarchaeota archaeon]